MAVDPRNDDWVRGAQPLITRADDGWGMLVVALISAVLLAPLLYAAIVTRAALVVVGAAGILLLMAGAVVLFLLDMRDRRLISGGRRIAATVVHAEVRVTGTTRPSVRFCVEAEFVSPRTGETLSARLDGAPSSLRPVKKGDPVWVAYLDDDRYEAL